MRSEKREYLRSVGLTDREIDDLENATARFQKENHFKSGESLAAMVKRQMAAIDRLIDVLAKVNWPAEPASAKTENRVHLGALIKRHYGNQDKSVADEPRWKKNFGGWQPSPGQIILARMTGVPIQRPGPSVPDRVKEALRPRTLNELVAERLAAAAEGKFKAAELVPGSLAALVAERLEAAR